MNAKFLILTGCLLSFSLAKANEEPVKLTTPTIDVNKKREVSLGTVVHNETKKPVKTVNITAYISSKKEKNFTSDDEGNFPLNSLKPGVYKLVFEKTGYKRVIREKIEIKADEALQLTIEMAENEEILNFHPSPFQFSDY